MKYIEQVVTPQKQLLKILMDAIGCSVALAVFAYLISCAFPMRMTAFVPLTIAAFIISRHINWSLNPFFILQNGLSSKKVVYYIIAFQMGIAGAMYYRGSFGMPVLPAVFKSFAWVAVGIGIMEELVFRGFVQGRLNKINPALAIVFAAFAHASYKACLFLSPAVEYHYPIWLFYTWSLGAFILIGLLRYYSRSILAAVIVHAVFDLLVYAESLQAPWWVW